MKKFAIVFSMLWVSMNIFATTPSSHPIGTAIFQSLQNKAKLTQNTTTSIYYGGQDISRSIIATANESLWTGQQTLVG